MGKAITLMQQLKIMFSFYVLLVSTMWVFITHHEQRPHAEAVSAQSFRAEKAFRDARDRVYVSNTEKLTEALVAINLHLASIDARLPQQ